MVNTLRENKFISLAIIVGLICVMLLSSTRISMESRDNGVSLIMSVQDVETLAKLSGMDYDAVSQTLYSAGLSSIFTPNEVDETLNLFIGDSYNGENAVVGMLEDDSQYSHIPIEGFEYSEEVEVVRVFKLIDEYAARYAYLGYEGAEEIENLTYRTITDRNIRVIWLCPFIHSETGEIISNLDDYVSVIEGVGERIALHNLSLGQFTHFEGYTPNLWFILGCILLTIAVGVLLLGSVISLSSRIKTVLLMAGFWFSCIMWNVFPWLLPLCASIVFPCIGIWIVAELLDKCKFTDAKSVYKNYITLLGVAFAIALVGGFTVGAMQSSRAYLLAVTNFRGVKISQILPIVFAVFICFKTMYKGKTIREILQEYRGSNRVFFVALAILAAVAVVYISRTGDGIFAAGVYEQRFRNWLENLLLVRPRTKEFLFAWPCLATALALLSVGSRRYSLPFAIFTATGLASIVNTFCHSRSPIWLSLSRSAMGLGLGAIIGVVLIFVVLKIQKRSGTST